MFGREFLTTLRMMQKSRFRLLLRPRAFLVPSSSIEPNPLCLHLSDETVSVKRKIRGTTWLLSTWSLSPWHENVSELFKRRCSSVDPSVCHFFRRSVRSSVRPSVLSVLSVLSVRPSVRTSITPLLVGKRNDEQLLESFRHSYPRSIITVNACDP